MPRGGISHNVGVEPSPLVCEALAQAIAFSEFSPPAVILGLASDQPEVASWVLEHSPLLVDADLVDAVATGCPPNGPCRHCAPQ